MPNYTRSHTQSEQLRWAFISYFESPFLFVRILDFCSDTFVCVCVCVCVCVVCVCVCAGQHCSSANAWLIPRMVITYVSSNWVMCNGQGFSKGDLTNLQHFLQVWAELDLCWQTHTFDWELVQTANIKVHCALTHNPSKPAAGGMGRKPRDNSYL